MPFIFLLPIPAYIYVKFEVDLNNPEETDVRTSRHACLMSSQFDKIYLDRYTHILNLFSSRLRICFDKLNIRCLSFGDGHKNGLRKPRKFKRQMQIKKHNTHNEYFQEVL